MMIDGFYSQNMCGLVEFREDFWRNFRQNLQQNLQAFGQIFFRQNCV